MLSFFSVICDWLRVNSALSHFIELKPHVLSPWIQRVSRLHLTDCHLIVRSIGTCPFLLLFPSSPSLLSYLLLPSLQFKLRSRHQKEMSAMQYRASSPKTYADTYKHTHRRGRNPCFPAQTLLDHHHHSEEKTWGREGLESRGRQIRSAPIHLLIPPLVFSLIQGFFSLQWF